MREDFDKFDLEQDLQDLRADIDKLGIDLAHFSRKSTVGWVERKISKRPFRSVLCAFGAGVACCVAFKIWNAKK